MNLQTHIQFLPPAERMEALLSAWVDAVQGGDVDRIDAVRALALRYGRVFTIPERFLSERPRYG